MLVRDSVSGELLIRGRKGGSRETPSPQDVCWGERAARQQASAPVLLSLLLGPSGSRAFFLHREAFLAGSPSPLSLFFPLSLSPTSKMEKLESQPWAVGGKQQNLVRSFNIPSFLPTWLGCLDRRDGVPSHHQQGESHHGVKDTCHL